MGWRRILFVDDDIFQREIGPTLNLWSLVAAGRAVGAGRCAVVGWTEVGYDDNSVLCRIGPT